MKLELLLKAYLELIQMWGKAQVGETSSRIWAASRFLEKLIKEEFKK